MVEATSYKPVRPVTASNRVAHVGVPVNHDYMRDDITQNLPQDLQYVNSDLARQASERNPKYQVFRQWLLENGAVFDDMVEFPSVFLNGALEGLSAKQPIGPHKAYIFIPNKLIISVARVKACPELRQLLQENFDLFGDVHPDREQLALATFLLYHYLKGPNASFWYPYIDVMNESDLLCDWSSEEVAQFMDKELEMDAELYKSEIETEWAQIEPVLQRYESELFPGYTKELFLRMYNYACTRCFGWTLPSTMMVPLADFMNHLPIDTSYDVYSKASHEVK